MLFAIMLNTIILFSLNRFFRNFVAKLQLYQEYV